MTLNNNVSLIYRHLAVAPGLKLDCSEVEGLEEALGKNGVTSNYRYDLAPYTSQLVQDLHRGKALFTQPPMPIECAGAPQKHCIFPSMADGWRSIPYRYNISDIPILGGGGGAGDVMNTANAKTMAAARKKAPVVAQNICDAIAGQALSAAYKGSGSCLLTVENR